MNALRRAGIGFLAACALMVVFSWPLPRYFSTGIPSSSSNIEMDNARRMIPGDHLQLLYHMWLGHDTFAGRTPWFYNLYEFNIGDDAERYEVRPYYLPFSLFYALGAEWGGRAFGWNLSILITLWITFLFSWRLARRYHPDEGVAALLALIPIAFPFTWIALLGGSPTGFAMMWVPILLYGLDRWVGDKSWAGAAWAGAALFFAEWSDTHVFFFNVLITPFWCVFSYNRHIGWRWPRWAEVGGWLRTSLPLLFFLTLAGLKAASVHQGLQDTAIAGGRSLHEVSLFSHGMQGWVSLRSDGDGRKIYLGYYAIALLVAAGFGALIRLASRKTAKEAFSLLLLLGGIAGMLILSTGVRNPWGPRAWEILMKAIPPYGMIRQPDKIFCLLPIVLMVVGALAFNGLGRWSRGIRGRGLALLLLLPLVGDYAFRLNPTVCVLDTSQGAYAAVAKDAEEAGEKPHAIVLPLWPGDSHFSSLYQHYVSLYRIRMVNGYRPTVRQAYREAIFDPYESMNLGYPTDEQLDGLLARGIRYVLLHEDVFPEKVSSFPIDVTLLNLLQHPRLQLLDRDGPVWSWVILDEPREEDNEWSDLSVPVLFPVRYWDWERSDWPESAIVKAPDAVGGRYVHVEVPMSKVAVSQRAATAGPMPMEWHTRVRGTGTVEWVLWVNDEWSTETQTVAAPDWTWLRMPVPHPVASAEQQADLRVMEGVLDLDALLLTRAGWGERAESGSMVLPAITFFHAGYTLRDFSGVQLRRAYDPSGEIFYSKNLYLEPGQYRVNIRFSSDAPDGTLLGDLVMRSLRRGEPDVRAPLRVGAVTELLYEQPDSRFFRCGFDYSRAADMVIHEISFQRITDVETGLEEGTE